MNDTTYTRLYHCKVAVSDNDMAFVKENFPLLPQEHQAKVYYTACYEGQLDMVKYMLEEINFPFDEAYHGCSRDEYGFMGACHPEGKKVLDYFIKDRKIQISDQTDYWLSENKLGKVRKKLGMN